MLEAILLPETAMPGDYLPDDLKTLWKELSANPLRISPHQLRQETEKLRKGPRRRSIVGGGAAWIAIAASVVSSFAFHGTLQRIGSALTVAGAAYLVVQLRMRPARAMLEMGETGCVRFYRAELGAAARLSSRRMASVAGADCSSRSGDLLGGFCPGLPKHSSVYSVGARSIFDTSRNRRSVESPCGAEVSGPDRCARCGHEE